MSGVDGAVAGFSVTTEIQALETRVSDFRQA
jgi:hypothetical protein